MVQMEEFLHLGHQRIAKLLKCDHLNVTSEEQVYEAILAWIRYDVGERRQYVAELMANVRMAMMSKAYFVSHVETEPLLQDNAQCRDYISEVYRYHMPDGQRSASVQSSQALRHRSYVERYLLVIGGTYPSTAIEYYSLRGNLLYQRNNNIPTTHIGYVLVVRMCESGAFVLPAETKTV